MGPFELLKLASSVEKFLHEVHVVALDEVRVQLDKSHSAFQNQLSMTSKSVKRKRKVRNKEGGNIEEQRSGNNSN